MGALLQDSLSNIFFSSVLHTAIPRTIMVVKVWLFLLKGSANKGRTNHIYNHITTLYKGRGGSALTKDAKCSNTFDGHYSNSVS